MWIDSGDMVYIGRKDDQVKIRGYRIDSREIESELLKLDNITNASITIINNESDENEERILFCFPPIIGYGIIYTQLAKELEKRNKTVAKIIMLDSDIATGNGS